jgi:glycosyltransferase involved in cell wall biosynthesis
MASFSDCDLLVFISDRISDPLLPLTPYVMMVYDYIQRHEKMPPELYNNQYFYAAKNAKKVLFTTEFTKQNGLQFAGLSEAEVVKCPMLIPKFNIKNTNKLDAKADYFLWTTNLVVHKNHKNAFKALSIYYKELDGKLKCYITGVGTKEIAAPHFLHLKNVSEILKDNEKLDASLVLCGEVADAEYRKLIKGSAFLWHPARVDNGTFSVIEAASLKVPSLSSDYPPMREINDMFQLNLLWMDPWDPMDMAKQLKHMELNARQRRQYLPSEADLATHQVEKKAAFYWDIIKEYL